MSILTATTARTAAADSNLAERIVEAVRGYPRPATVSGDEFMAAAEAVCAQIQLPAPALDPTDPSKPWI